MIKIGLVGYGKAGKAVASVLVQDDRFELCWIARRSNKPTATEIPVTRLNKASFSDWLEQHPVDAIVDFSDCEAVLEYGDAARRHGLILLSAISNYPPETMAYIRELGQHIRVMSSPNITLGINFLLLAARLLRQIAPFADVGIVEQHFRDKSDVSGTAKRIAETLEVDEDEITSLRLGGIIGHHEVIFGFPHQTVRLIHDSIRREAFGTGAAFALSLLSTRPVGLYSYEELLLALLRQKLQGNGEIQGVHA